MISNGNGIGLVEFGYTLCPVPEYLGGVLLTGLAEVSIVMLLSRVMRSLLQRICNLITTLSDEYPFYF